MVVNGKKIALQADISLGKYLETNGYDTGRVAVEINGNIIPQISFATEILCDDDTIEVVQFVGGG